MIKNNSIAESEELFSQLVNNINEVLWLVDMSDNKIIYLSPTFEELWGISIKATIPDIKTIINTIHPDDKARIYDAYKGLKELGDPLAEEFRIIRPDGDIRWIWGRAYPVKNTTGETYRFAGIAEDITKRHLAEVELRITMAKAEESDKLKRAFLANISHEIRTPMNGIIGFSELLCREEHTPEKRAFYSNVISESAAQLITIVNNILDLSKIETGQLLLVNEDIHLESFMYEIYGSHKSKAELKKLDFIFNYNSTSNIYVSTDVNRLTQVFTILIENAIKFTSAGTIKLGYSIKDEFIEFFVEDSGIGISKEFHERIFSRFEQADYDLSREYGGTGVGLALAKNIVELLGGKIWFVSEPGKGSVFYFTIPNLSVDTNEISGQETTMANANKLNAEKYIVLVAEDENLNYLFIEEILENTNVELIHAHDGSEAVSVFQLYPEINLVLMDIKMPIMNGLDATRRIKNLKPSVPIIAITACAMDNDRQNAFAAGCDDYLAKPLNSDELLEVISKYISVKQSDTH